MHARQRGRTASNVATYHPSRPILPVTRREGVSRVASGECISFIHEIADGSVEDITAEILSEAALPDIGLSGADLQSCRFNHITDLQTREGLTIPSQHIVIDEAL